MRTRSQTRTKIEALLKTGMSNERIAASVGCHSGYVRKIKNGNCDKQFRSDVQRNEAARKQAADRRNQRLQMYKTMVAKRNAGATYEELRKEFGYASRGSAWQAVTRGYANAQS